MHINDRWLPPNLSREVAENEPKRFHALVEEIIRVWNNGLDGPEPILPFVSHVKMFLYTKEVFVEDDIIRVCNVAFGVLFSNDDLLAQVRWMSVLIPILRKYRKTLQLTVQWRPLYTLMHQTHFKSQSKYRGAIVYQIHLQSIVRLIRVSRRYFPAGSAAQIWAEFRPYLSETTHNISLEALGFLSLLLPTMPPRETSGTPDPTAEWGEWLPQAMDLWASVPNCLFWSQHWLSIISNCAKHVPGSLVPWDRLSDRLFTHFTASFELPVGRLQGSSPVKDRHTPKSVSTAFGAGTELSRPRNVAKCIAYLCGAGTVLGRTEALVDSLEQFYHPSNGGKWTWALEKFLGNFYHYFCKRLLSDTRGLRAVEKGHLAPLDWSERERLVRCFLRILDRAQFSKNSKLSGTAGIVAAGLVHFSPSLALPPVVDRFRQALETETATHQLEASLLALAGSVRPILLASLPSDQSQAQQDVVTGGRELIAEALVATLPGVDANDPDKTMATMEFYLSVISNVGQIGDVADGGSGTLAVDWSDWTDSLLSQIFALLCHVSADSDTGEESRTFLMKEAHGNIFGRFVELLFSRMTPPLLQQAARQVSRFVLTTVLPGGVEDVAQICLAVTYADSDTAMASILVPLCDKALSLLEGTHSTGFSSLTADTELKNMTVRPLSPALERSVCFYCGVIGEMLWLTGPKILPHSALLRKVLTAALNAPSAKLNEVGGRFLGNFMQSLIVYYPIDEFRSNGFVAEVPGVEGWVGSKSTNESEAPVWHVPNAEQVNLAQELVQVHLEGAVVDMERLCSLPGDLFPASKSPGGVKDAWRVVLLRVVSSLEGLRTLLPDFATSARAPQPGALPLQVIGRLGVEVGSALLRHRTAMALHSACQYLLAHNEDDTVCLSRLASAMDLVANFGSMDYRIAVSGKNQMDDIPETFEEPIGARQLEASYAGVKRPRWVMVERAYNQFLWRASQAGYRPLFSGQPGEKNIPEGVRVMLQDLTRLALNKYSSVQGSAESGFERIIKRFPALVPLCFPTIMAAVSESKQEEAIIGACELLDSRTVHRYISRSSEGMAAFMLGLLSSGKLETEKAQPSIRAVFNFFVLRFSGFPMSSIGGSSTHERVFQQVCSVVEQDPSGIHWRYSLMANAFLFFLAPENSSHISYLSQHFASCLVSDLPTLRLLATSVLFPLLSLAPFPKSLVSEEFAGKLLEKRSSDFQVPDAGEGGNGHHFSSLFSRVSMKDGSAPVLLVGALANSLFLPDFPTTKFRDNGAPQNGFSPISAFLFERLAASSNGRFADSVRKSLEKAISALADKETQRFAAELFAGILRDGDWPEWIPSLLKSAVQNCTVESTGDWSSCVRFAASEFKSLARKEIVESGPSNTNDLRAIQYRVLTIVMEPIGSGSSSGQLAKRMIMIGSVLAEILGSNFGIDDTELVGLQIKLLHELRTNMGHSARQVREQVGQLLAMMTAHWLAEEEEMSDCNQSMVEACTNLSHEIKEKAMEACKKAQQGNLGEPESDEINRWMETVFFMLTASVKSGEINCQLSLLPALLTFQDAPNQDLALLAKQTLAYTKYHQMTEIQLAEAIDAVISAAGAASWHQRAAALSFMQALVFRHSFLLEPKQSLRLREAVLALLSDAHLEVREFASATLCSFLRGNFQEWGQELRDTCLTAVNLELVEMQKKSRKKKPKNQQSQQSEAQADIAVQVARRHGLVLFLTSIIGSSPYDVPDWMPDVLLALAQFAHEPAPVQTTVRKAFGEFKRTHGDSWRLHSSKFTSDQLDILSEMGASNSYFA